MIADLQKVFLSGGAEGFDLAESRAVLDQLARLGDVLSTLPTFSWLAALVSVWQGAAEVQMGDATAVAASQLDESIAAVESNATPAEEKDMALTSVFQFGKDLFNHAVHSLVSPTTLMPIERARLQKQTTTRARLIRLLSKSPVDIELLSTEIEKHPVFNLS